MPALYTNIVQILKFSRQTKNQADELLKQGKVIDILSKYGKVVVTGSYKYDLMYGPDIDLIVLSEDPGKDAEKALIDFVSERNFQKYQFGDFYKHPINKRPKSYIVVLIHEYKGRRWEIEVWFHKRLPTTDVDSELEEMLLSVSDRQREVILNLKHQLEVSKTSKHKLNSVALYKGVLQEGKVSIEQY